MKHAEIDIASVARTCAESPPGQNASGLLDGLGRLLPGLEFRPVLTRSGWYRPGGIVDIELCRVADSLRQWADTQVAHGGAGRRSSSSSRSRNCRKCSTVT